MPVTEIKISEMTPTISIVGDELVPLVQGGLNKYATPNQISVSKIDDSFPTAENGAIYFNPSTGLLYIKVAGVWVNLTEAVLLNYNPIANQITVTPVGGITSTNVQDALAELDTKKKASSYLGAYANELVSVPGSGGTLTLKNSYETYITDILTNSHSFTIALSSPISGQINESILIFKIGTNLPTITQPTGIVWRGIAPTLVINTTWTITYEQVQTGISTYEIYGLGVKNN